MPKLLTFAAAVLLAGVLAVASAWAGVVDAAADTLEGALQQAYQNNPQLNAQRAILRQTDEGVPQALAGYRPRVTANASIGTQNQETLSRTNLAALSPGSLVNVERSLRLADRLGGHLVTGHIDAVGTLAERKDEGDWSTMWFYFPAALARQLASKGSIAVDGVSLTLVDVLAERFSVALIPHTLQVTTLGRLRVGGAVNLETDLLAKYVERQLAGFSKAP